MSWKVLKHPRDVTYWFVYLLILCPLLLPLHYNPQTPIIMQQNNGVFNTALRKSLINILKLYRCQKVTYASFYSQPDKNNFKQFLWFHHPSICSYDFSYFYTALWTWTPSDSAANSSVVKCFICFQASCSIKHSQGPLMLTWHRSSGLHRCFF